MVKRLFLAFPYHNQTAERENQNRSRFQLFPVSINAGMALFVPAAAKCAFIFTQNITQAKRLTALMETANCKPIGNIQINHENTKPR